jgi:phosphopantetheinyl transferase
LRFSADSSPIVAILVAILAGTTLARGRAKEPTMTPTERVPPLVPPFDLAISRSEVAAGLTFACATVSDQISPATQGALERLLDDDERATYLAIDHHADRRCYAAARGLLRIELSFHLALAPQDWQYVPRPGHPAGIRTPLGRIDRLRFSLSHTRGLVACAVADPHAGPFATVGIDVEWVRGLPHMTKLAQRHFAPPEVEALLGLTGAERNIRFFSLWTLRQAWLKSRACSSQPDLFGERDLIFNFDQAGQLASTTPPSGPGGPRAGPPAWSGGGDGSSGWQFWLHPFSDARAQGRSSPLRGGGHLLALAARKRQSLV